MSELFPLPTAWTREDTAEYLTANPLPSDFEWKHRDGARARVHPSYRTHGGYGKWLRETPYFPGLFELIHDLIFKTGQVPAPEKLAEQLRAIERERNGQQSLF